MVLPAGILIGFTFALLLGGFLLLGRHPSSVIFVSLGTLTGSYAADRLARGWYYLGGQNGIPVDPVDDPRLATIWTRAGVLLFRARYPRAGLSACAASWCARSSDLALAGLRENEQRIAFFGYRCSTSRRSSFAIAGAIAGLAGSLYAFHEGFVWPNMLGVVMSTQVVLYVLFGGSGTLIGAVIGTIVIEAVSFWLSNSYQDIWPIILGVLLLLVILFRPAGLISLIVGERERVGNFGRPPKERQSWRSLRHAASPRYSAS